MRISIREALFSGEEVDAWTPPKSDYINIQTETSKDWSDEFKSLKGLKKQDNYIPKHVGYFTGPGIDIMSDYGAFTWDYGFVSYYYPDKDLIFFYNTSYGDEKYVAQYDVNTVLDFLASYELEDRKDSLIGYDEIFG